MRKYFYSAGLVLGMLAAAPAYAGELSVTTSVDVVSDYVFRGVSLADTSVQPGVEASYGNFYAGTWFSNGIGDTADEGITELDLYAGYGRDLTDLIAMDVGVTYYHYPESGDLFDTKGGFAGSYEVFGGLAFDTMLSPSVYAYYDFNFDAFTLEGGVSHSFPLSEKVSLDVGATAGLVDAEDGVDWEYGQLSASLGYAFTDNASTYIAANYALSSEDTLDFKVDPTLGEPYLSDDNLFFFGAGISTSF